MSCKNLKNPKTLHITNFVLPMQLRKINSVLRKPVTAVAAHQEADV